MTYRPYSSLNASGIADTRANNTGADMPKGTPIRINTSGELDFIDVSVEDHVMNVAGVVNSAISNTTSGSFITTGKVANITTSANFGDVLYISKTGGLTNTKPSIGVGGYLSGDFIVSVGVVAKNTDNAAQKDLVVIIDVVGQL